MIVKAIFKDENFNYFRDIETDEKRFFGDIFECDEELAKERIEKKLVKKASKKEEEEYLKAKEEAEKAKENSEKEEKEDSEKENDENKENE